MFIDSQQRLAGIEAALDAQEHIERFTPSPVPLALHDIADEPEPDYAAMERSLIEKLRAQREERELNG